MTAIETTGAHRRLPVLATVRHSYGYIWERRSAYAPPMLMLAAILTVVNFLSVTDGAAHLSTAPLGALGVALGLVLKIAVLVAFAVGQHRAILLDDLRFGPLFFRWDAHFRAYLAVLIILAVLLILYFGAVSLAGVLLGRVVYAWSGHGLVPAFAVGGLAMLVLFLATARVLSIYLVLPAAALDQPLRISAAWRAGAGNGLRMLGTYLLAALPFFVLTFIVMAPHIIDGVAALSAHEPRPPMGPITKLLLALLNAASIPVLLAGLSFSYDVLVRGNEPTRENR